MEKIIELSTQISTPLMLAGIVVAVLWGVFKYIINRSPDWAKKDSSTIIILIVNWIGLLSLVSIVLGFSGYAIKIMEVKFSSEQSKSEQSDFLDSKTQEHPDVAAPPYGAQNNNCASLQHVNDEQIRKSIETLRRKHQYGCAIDALNFIRSDTGIQEECESLIRYFIARKEICLSKQTVGKCSKYINETEYRKLIELETLKLPQEVRCNETNAS